MKRFSFNLQKVLKLRKFKEEESKIALGQAISALTVIENKIKENAVKHHNASSERFTDTRQMIAWDNYIIRLEQEAKKLTEQAAQAELIVEEKRAIYIEASKELKAMEKLKEKREKEYRKEMFDYQMAETDDMTSARRMWRN
jgi:flagellar FliJ protein